MEITKEEMEAYETVRASGKTNMFNMGSVTYWAVYYVDVYLTKEKIGFIMLNYTFLMDKFGIERK